MAGYSTMKSITRFTTVAVGATVVLPHGIIRYGVAQTPDFMASNPGEGIALSADDTDITLTNNRGVITTVDVYCEYWHVDERVFDYPTVENLTPQPFVFNQAGAGAVQPAFISGSVQTTNAVATTIYTLPVPDLKATTLTVQITGYDAGNTGGAGFNIIGTFRRNAGAVTQIGALATPASQNDLAVSATMLVSGTNVLVQVTGTGILVINWKMSGTVLSSS